MANFIQSSGDQSATQSNDSLILQEMKTNFDKILIEL